MGTGSTSTNSIAQITASDCLALFKSKDLSPVEVVKDCLARIDTENAVFNAFCFVDFDGALSAAQMSEERWLRGAPVGPLDGVPTTLKDLTLSRGMPTRRGSATTTCDGPWTIDSAIASRLREAGAVFLGKTNCPEFGWKGLGDSPLYGITRNPWRSDLTPGGSSSGAAVAASLNLGFLHQGSDAGGSIRIPASFTGTYGFKPTFGHVPQWPASVLPTLSHLGPITRTVADALLMMNVISGNDPRDGHAGPRHQYRRDVSHTIKGMRIAFSPTLGYASVADDIATVVANAVEYLAEMGADVTEVDPGFSDPIDVMETLVFAGFARILRTLNGSQIALLDPGFLKAAERGLSLSLPNYQDAQEARANLKARMNEFHEKFELLITPTVPIAPFEAGKDVPDPRYEKWTDWSPFTYPFNLTQQPAASLPAGLDTSGLPVGLQIVGAQFADSTVLAVSQLLEKQLGLLAPPNNAAK